MKRTFILLIFSFVLLGACKKGHYCDCIESAGDYIIDTIQIESFDTLLVNDVFTINLVQDSVDYAVVKAYEAFYENILFEVTDNTLNIDNLHNCTWTKPKKNEVEIDFHYKDISKIIVEEPSVFNSINDMQGDEIGIIFNCHVVEANLKLNARVFFYWNTNGGMLNLEGKVDELKIWNTTLGSVNALNLNAQKVLVENNSVGDCLVNVQKDLKTKIKNTGNVYYTGEPEYIDAEINENSGKLLKYEK